MYFVSTALVGALAGMFGGFFGGFLMSKLKLKVPGAALLMIISMCASIIGIFISMMLPCPQVEMGGVIDPVTKL